MGAHLDELLRSTVLSSDEDARAVDLALQRARAAAGEELGRAGPIRSWRRELARVVAAVWAPAAGVGAAALMLGLTTPALLVSRAPRMVAVGLVTAVCLWAALSPRGFFGARLGALAAAIAAGGWLVLARAAPAAPGVVPEWVCTVSHVLAGLPALVLVWRSLRSTAPAPLRSLLAGAGIGTVGVLIGEIACVRGTFHVAAYHLGAWALLAVAATVVGARLQRRAYAP